MLRCISFVNSCWVCPVRLSCYGWRAKLMETRNKRLPSSKYDSQDDDEQHTSQKKNKGGENKKKNNNSPDKDGDEKEDRKDAALPIDRTSVYAKGLKSVDPHAPEFHSYSNIYNINDL